MNLIKIFLPKIYLLLIPVFLGALFLGIDRGDAQAIDTPTITLISPNGGTLQKGEDYSLVFSYENPGTAHVIHRWYQRSDGTLVPIIPSSGFLVGTSSGSVSHIFTVPELNSTLPSGNDYRILLEVIGNNGNVVASDTSDAFITIEEASSVISPECCGITVTSPNGGGSLKRGWVYDITWNSTGILVNHDIIIQLHGGGLLDTLAIVPNSGSYRWTVPADQALGSDFRIRLIYNRPDSTTLDPKSGAQDDSDTSFSIVLAPTITVTSPKGGESFKIGEGVNITWDSTDIPSTEEVLIVVRRDNIWQFLGFVANTGSYTWMIPSTQLTEPGYFIKVTHSPPEHTQTTPQSFPFGVSNGFFSIVAGESASIIAVTSPNGGESFGRGTSVNITWISQNIAAAEEVLIYVQQGSGSTFLAATTNTGSYVWNIPSNYPTSVLYLIRIVAPGAVQDWSDAHFSIRESTVVPINDDTDDILIPPKEDTILEDGMLITSTSSGDVYVMRNGQRVLVPSVDAFNAAGYEWQKITTVSEATISKYSVVSLIRSIGEERVYKIVDDTKKIWIPTAEAFTSRNFGWQDVVLLRPIEVEGYAWSRLLRARGDSRVYFINEKGLKHHILSEEVFLSYGNKFEDVLEVSQEDLDIYENNKLIRFSGDEKIYFIENGSKQWIKTAEVFESRGFTWSDVTSVNQVEIAAYPEGRVIE